MKRWMPALMIGTVVLGACASLDPTRSYVEPLRGNEGQQLGKAIVDYMTQAYPAANTTLLLVPPQDNQQDNPLIQALRSGLAQAGFAIAESPVNSGSGTHRLLYRVTVMDGVRTLRFSVDDTEITRVYTTDDSGALVPASFFSVRK
jgi:uncharacterized lipoprotein YmbA